MRKEEEKLHRQICTFLRLQYPNLIFNTDLSGIKLTMGQAKKVKLLRSSRGFPDLVIYEPTALYHGLFIEIKCESPYKKKGEIKKNKHLIEQSLMIERLKEKGYYACFVWNFKMFESILTRYLVGERL